MAPLAFGFPPLSAAPRLTRMAIRVVGKPLAKTGKIRPPFTSKLALLFEITGTENPGVYKRHLLPAETKGAIAPVRGNVPRIPNKSANLEVNDLSKMPVKKCGTNSHDIRPTSTQSNHAGTPVPICAPRAANDYRCPRAPNGYNGTCQQSPHPFNCSRAAPVDITKGTRLQPGLPLSQRHPVIRAYVSSTVLRRPGRAWPADRSRSADVRRAGWRGPSQGCRLGIGSSPSCRATRAAFRQNGQLRPTVAPSR